MNSSWFVVCTVQFHLLVFVISHVEPHISSFSNECSSKVYQKNMVRSYENVLIFSCIRFLFVSQAHPKYECEFCAKRFLQKRLLDLHVRCFHTETTCRICKTTFKRRKYLLRHMKVHRRQTYPCDQCKLKFLTS